MYIANIHIENYRNFSSIDIPLKPFTVVVGKNDSGKSNLVDALNTVLYNNKGRRYERVLSAHDFNSLCVDEFVSKVKTTYECMKDDFTVERFVEELILNAPTIIIRMRFEDAKNIYEQSLLRDWLNGDENLQYFEVEFKYFLKDRKRLESLINDLKTEDLLEERHADFPLILECYDYSLKSTNNNKDIDNTKMRTFVSNTINAERDSFASGDTNRATRIVSDIINSGMNLRDKAELSKRYNEFFNGIQSLESFRSIYDDILTQNQSIENFIKDISLTPNAKKYKDIVDNITIRYGEDMLFQRGLGTRNLISLLTLYSYFLHDVLKRFSLVCIEERKRQIGSHLSKNTSSL